MSKGIQLDYLARFYVDWDRPETAPCERGTAGCCVSHTASPDFDGCECW